MDKIDLGKSIVSYSIISAGYYTILSTDHLYNFNNISFNVFTPIWNSSVNSIRFSADIA